MPCQMIGRKHRQRRVAAIVACFAWLLAVEVLPALHEARHQADHTHAADGSIVALHDHDHHHAQPAHHDDDNLRPGQLAFDHVPHGHRAGGIAHHAVALHQPPPPLLAPLPVLRREEPVIAELADQLTSTTAAAHPARGPPAHG